jgi:putative phosphoesterase
MVRIGLLSDTHGYLDPRVFKFFVDVDQIWHAGDLGTIDVARQLESFKPLVGVHGNIDGAEIRQIYPADQRFDCEGLDVWITHIGGYPGRYDRRVQKQIVANPPGLFITGHSHILRVKKDKRLNLLHLNPGAAGNQGFHKVKTMLMFEIKAGTLGKLQAVDLGARGSVISNPS